MGFAGAGVAEQHQRFTLVDPAAGCQMSQDGGGEVGDAGVVEVGEPFGARELGLMDQPDPAPGVSFVAFSGQHPARNALCDRRCLTAAAASWEAWARMVGSCKVFAAAAMVASAAGSASRDRAAVIS